MLPCCLILPCDVIKNFAGTNSQSRGSTRHSTKRYDVEGRTSTARNYKPRPYVMACAEICGSTACRLLCGYLSQGPVVSRLFSVDFIYVLPFNPFYILGSSLDSLIWLIVVLTYSLLYSSFKSLRSLFNRRGGQAMGLHVYVGSRIPITVDGQIEKRRFERRNRYALGTLFTKNLLTFP